MKFSTSSSLVVVGLIMATFAVLQPTAAAQPQALPGTTYIGEGRCRTQEKSLDSCEQEGVQDAEQCKQLCQQYPQDLRGFDFIEAWNHCTCYYDKGTSPQTVLGTRPDEFVYCNILGPGAGTGPIDSAQVSSAAAVDCYAIDPPAPGGSSGGAVATISVAPSMSPSLVPSASMSPSVPTFNLESYKLPDPACALTGDDNVQCNFTNIVPTTGNLEYSITSFENCNGTNPDTSAISLPSEVTKATAINGTDSVTIDLTTDFVLADKASTAYLFCLLTKLKDDNGNMMIYQGQKINTTFVADGDFTVSSITSEKYEGINDETNTNTKTFGVTATRCDINRNPVSSSSPLAIGATLFICIDSIDAGPDKSVVIKKVDTFGAKKEGDDDLTDLLEGNTDMQGEETAAVIIGTRPFASFFEDATPLVISGTVTLEVTENNNNDGGDAVRRLSVRILQSGETDEFELQVELEAVEESSARPSTAFGVAGSALIAGAIAAVAAM